MTDGTDSTEQKAATTKADDKESSTPAVDAKPAAESTEKSADKKSEKDESSTETEPAEKKQAEPAYEPLEDVREQIIRTLKDQKARAKISDAIESLTGQISALFCWTDDV